MMTILIVYLIIGILFSIGFVIEYYKNDGSPIIVKIIIILLIAAFYPVIIGGLVGEKFR